MKGNAMSVEMKLDTNPSQDDLDTVLDGLQQFNIAQAGDPGRSRFGVFIRDDSGSIIGGLNATISSRWLHIDILWLPDSLRGGGWGSKLLKAAEAHGRKTGCVSVWLDTFSFQAPGFYLKQGYTEYASLNDFPPGHSRHFFLKRLQ